MPNDLRLRIHSDDPRLKRWINHDPGSADYRLDTSGLSLVDVDWPLMIPRLNQGSTGKCTAESACEILGSEPFFPTLPDGVGAELNDTWTDAFYSDEETLDGNGAFPPTDDGSSGLTSAKVAKDRGLISGYEHTFTAEDALKGLQLRPFAWGTLWKSGMDDVDTTTGQVRYSGTTRGGHELSGFKLDVLNERLWCNQHWGPWGYQLGGTFWIGFDDFAKSLADQGDVTFYTPLNQPSPSPAPSPTPSAATVTKTYSADAWAVQEAFLGSHPNWKVAQAIASGVSGAVSAAGVSSPDRVDVYRDRGGDWRWRRIARNGANIASSGEGFSSLEAARKAANRANPDTAVTVVAS